MIDHSKKAVENFLNGYNCSQSVLLAFSDVTGLDEKTALLISSSFGGGMGRLREVCGAVSGMFMSAGLLFGYTDNHDNNAKMNHYKLVRELAAEFREENGSIICRELTGLTDDGSPVPTPRDAQFYQKRRCTKYIADCARQLDRLLCEGEINEGQH